MAEGRVLWAPSERFVSDSRLAGFMAWLRDERGLPFDDYDALWRWSVEDLEAFWRAVWEFFDVPASAQPTRILADRTMPGASWFEGARLNYAEMALAGADDRPAFIFEREDGSGASLTRSELADAVGSVAAALRGMGVGPGDRVAAYLPNIPETVIAFLASASIGAVWSSCSPDFGAQAVIDRFQQIEPSVLFAVEGYRYGGAEFDRREVLDRITEAIPSATCVIVPSGTDAAPPPATGRTPWRDLIAHPSEPSFEQVAFDHPLWILYSSGTTGLPKAMVQGHGGILLEHLKSLALHLDLGTDSRFFWFTTTGWMMWNFLIGGLLVGSTIVLYDGSPAFPDLGALWRLAERTRITYFGTSAPFLHASMKANVEPRGEANLEMLEAIGSTGAPLSPEGFSWVADHLGTGIWLGSISGGTDICTAVVGSCPIVPVHEGEIQCRALGARVEAYDTDGRSVVGDVGELVITAPMPSMPVGFWNDPEGRRYRQSYFDVYPGVWRHGDWITILPNGGCVISGRSDATLNRGGVRIGTAELYRIVEAVPGVRASLVVDTGGLGSEGELVLFVVPDDSPLSVDLRATITGAVRSKLSPRHAPDRIVEAPGIPTTLNGKRMEVPVKRLLKGESLDAVANVDAVSDPDVLRWFAAFGSSVANG